MPNIRRRSPRRSPRRSARRSARRSPRRSVRRSARRSARRSPRRSARRSAHRLHGGEMDASVLMGGRRKARRSPSPRRSVSPRRRRSPRRSVSPRRDFVNVHHAAPRMVISGLPLTLREMCVQAEDIESGRLKVELNEVTERIAKLKLFATQAGVAGEVYPATMVNLCNRISERLNRPSVTDIQRIKFQNSMDAASAPDLRGFAGGRRKSPRRSARKSPRRSARKSPRRSARKSPRRSARKSPRRSARRSLRRSPRLAAKRP